MCRLRGPWLWALRALKNTNPENVLPSTYLPLAHPNEVNFSEMYGDLYKILQSSTHEYDPPKVAQTRLGATVRDNEIKHSVRRPNLAKYNSPAKLLCAVKNQNPYLSSLSLSIPVGVCSSQ